MIDDIRRWIVICESAHDGDAYFDLQDIAEIHNHKSRATLVYMSPVDFIAMAEVGHDTTKEAGIASLLQKGVKFSSTPMLQFVHNGKGLARVVGHEGRHRARALQAIGIKEMPVVLRSLATLEGPAIRWGSQDNKYDRIAVMPTRLQSQHGPKTISFPKSVIY